MRSPGGRPVLGKDTQGRDRGASFPRTPGALQAGGEILFPTPSCKPDPGQSRRGVGHGRDRQRPNRRPARQEGKAGRDPRACHCHCGRGLESSGAPESGRSRLTSPHCSPTQDGVPRSDAKWIAQNPHRFLVPDRFTRLHACSRSHEPPLAAVRTLAHDARPAAGTRGARGLGAPAAAHGSGGRLDVRQVW
jgi:hypothetical protein